MRNRNTQRIRSFGGLARLLSSPQTLAMVLALGLVGCFWFEDHFADNLELPKDVELSEPSDTPFMWEADSSAIPDGFQAAVKGSLKGPGSSDTSLTPAIPALARLHDEHPELLKRYLAAHPAWWFHVYRGNAFATRRWHINGHWTARLHGYFSNFADRGGPRFQTRTCLGMSGRPWHRGTHELTTGQKADVPLATGNRLHESHVFWREGGITVEVFEQSESMERRMTKASIGELQAEFASLLEQPTWEHAKTLFPVGAITEGNPSFELRNGMQGGIYSADIRCNPGEPGRLYLKAFEITGETPLSVARLKGRTSEYLGWSEDPKELFASHVRFTIYEGNWEQYYGARFEVWFTPESGTADRKLMESNWKIQGWMH